MSRRFPLGGLIAAGATVAIGLFFLIGAFHIDTRAGVLGGPDVVPKAASALLVGFGILIALEAFLVPPAGAGRDGRPSVLVFVIVAGGLAYVWLIGAIGYLPATLLAAPLAFAAFGVRGPTRALAAGLCAALVIYAAFFVGLGIYDPPGRLLDLNGLWR